MIAHQFMVNLEGVAKTWEVVITEVNTIDPKYVDRSLIIREALILTLAHYAV